ncbi:MAG: hypothetical protein DCC75_08320 [Proteobacteria bacterium]|nr:MAG: hypothetical protein DCC75_08320 [Pseudomonadota bacterium]
MDNYRSSEMRMKLLLSFLCVLLASCSAPKGTIKERRGEVFATEQQALEHFKSAFRSEDLNQLIPIFGEEGRDIILTGDPIADRAAMRRIARRLDDRAELIATEGHSFKGEQWYKLRFGKEGWNMRIPLVNSGDGWYWATYHAAEAAQDTRIAINELTTMHTLVELVAAERQYYSRDRDGDGVMEYAQRLISTSGKRDGLYWPTGSGQESSPLQRLVSEALKDGYTDESGRAQAYEGYIYRVLHGQGSSARGGQRSYLVGDNMTQGFAILATPREWNKSGANSFVIDMTGRMYKKDLGFRTTQIAKELSAHDPDPTWILVDRSYYGDDGKPAPWQPSRAQLGSAEISNNAGFGALRPTSEPDL